MNVKQIIKKYLKENGYDGLHTIDCGCRRKDPIICGGDPSLCKPGYIKWDWCEWKIVPKKK